MFTVDVRKYILDVSFGIHLQISIFLHTLNNCYTKIIIIIISFFTALGALSLGHGCNSQEVLFLLLSSPAERSVRSPVVRELSGPVPAWWCWSCSPSSRPRRRTRCQTPLPGLKALVHCWSKVDRRCFYTIFPLKKHTVLHSVDMPVSERSGCWPAKSTGWHRKFSTQGSIWIPRSFQGEWVATD